MGRLFLRFEPSADTHITCNSKTKLWEATYGVEVSVRALPAVSVRALPAVSVRALPAVSVRTLPAVSVRALPAVFARALPASTTFTAPSPPAE